MNPTQPNTFPLTNLHKPLIVDVDEVLLDWTFGGFKPHFETITGKTLCEKGNTHWDMSDWLGLSYQDMLEHIQNFNRSDRFAQLPPFLCAQKILPKIAQTGRAIHVVTSCADDLDTQRRRRRNLETSFGDIFTSITSLGLHATKKSVLADLAHRAGHTGFWVEDNVKNAHMGLDIGHTTFVMRRSHNRLDEANCNLPTLNWVDTWFEIAPHLLEKETTP